MTEKALDHLRAEGFAVLRGAVPRSDVTTLKKKVDKILEGPAIAGSIGYFMKDPFKKTYDALLLGREAIDVVTVPRQHLWPRFGVVI